MLDPDMVWQRLKTILVLTPSPDASELFPGACAGRLSIRTGCMVLKHHVRGRATGTWVEDPAFSTEQSGSHSTARTQVRVTNAGFMPAAAASSDLHS